MTGSFLIAQQGWNLDVWGQVIVTVSMILGGFILYWAIKRVGLKFVERMSAKGGKEQAERYQTLYAVLRKLLAIALWFVGILFGFMIWNIPITPFLAVGTAAAAAIGFGAQDLVKDFIAGFFILAEDQFHIGDTVTIAGTTGTVEDIQLRVTVMRDYEGNVHFVPNGVIQVATNFTSNFSRPVVDVGIAYEEDVDRAIEVLLDEVRQLAQDEGFAAFMLGEPEVLGVNKLDDSAVVLRARLTTTADERWMVRREAMRRIKNRFDAEGISIPFPQISLNRKD